MIANVLGGASAAGVGFLIFLALPDQPFLTVHEMKVVGDQVAVTRSVPEPAGVADWSVVVVGDGVNAPSCQTQAGPHIHEGWSVYSPSPARSVSMHLDQWVGYPGCYEKLTEGRYDMFVTWTPRDGSTIATARTSFVK